MKNNQKEKPLTERNRRRSPDGEKPDGEPPEKPEGQEPNGGQELRESRAMVWKAMRR